MINFSLLLIILRDNRILLFIILYHFGPLFEIRDRLFIFDRYLVMLWIFDVVRLGDIVIKIFAN